MKVQQEELAMKKLWLLLKMTMPFNFVLIDGLKTQGWLKELRMFGKNTYKLVIIGRLCQKVSKPGANKSYDTLLKKASDLSIPVKLKFLKEVVYRLNSFLVNIQTDAVMVPLFVDKLEGIVRFCCSRFILPTTVEKVNSTL